MPNNVNSIKSVGTVIAKMAAAMLADKTQFLKSIEKEPASSFGQVNGYNVGDTITINKPARFVPGSTADITSVIQDVVEEKATLSLDTLRNVPVAMTSAQIQNDMALKDWSERVLDPAVSSIAQSVESAFLTVAKNRVYNLVGTAGSTVFDTDTSLAAREKINKYLAPMDDRRFELLDSTAMRSATNARKGLFQASSEIASQYKQGFVGLADGFTFLENNLLPTHTRGTATGAITVTTTSLEGATTIALTGTGAQTLKAGDVFTVAAVFAVHPITKAVYPFLQQFVVLADNTASGGAYTGVSISPTIYAGSGGLQNINALPQASAVVTLVGSASTGYTQNFAFHKQAFRFASVPLVKPDGLHMVGQETVDGMTIRVLMDYAILTDRMIMRLDFLGGFSAVRPEWAVRMTA